MRFIGGCLLLLLGAMLAFLTLGFAAAGLTPQDSGIPPVGVNVRNVVVGLLAAVLMVAGGVFLLWRVLLGR